VQTSDGKQASTDRLVSAEDSQKDKCWSKLGRLGDPLVVQILLKRQSSGEWKPKKFVVTCEAKAQAMPVSVPKAPRITCDDEEAGNDLLDCARYGELSDLKELLEDSTVPIDYQNESYNTALHYASANGKAECVELLLDRGAQHLPNSSGNTPLHWAVQNKHAAAVRALLARAPGVDVLQRNAFGKSALTDAFALETADITQLLLEHPSAAALDEPSAAAAAAAAPGAAAVVEEETDEAGADGDEDGEPAAGESMEVDGAPPAAAAAARVDGMEA
jgi:hypothetical protein